MSKKLYDRKDFLKAYYACARYGIAADKESKIVKNCVNLLNSLKDHKDFILRSEVAQHMLRDSIQIMEAMIK